MPRQMSYLKNKSGNMMDSKSKISSKRKSGSPKTDVKSKRSSKQEVKNKDSEVKHPQKSRWEPLQPSSTAGQDMQIGTSKKEEQKSHLHQQQIKDLLENKERIVEHLFHTVTGTALQELIPDYLKKYSIEELKALCATEIQKIPAEEILQIISGKYQPPDGKMESTISAEISTEKSDVLEKNTQEVKSLAKRSLPTVCTPDTAESFSNDVLELNPSSNEMKCITDEENQAPISVEEVAKDLYKSEKNADIIELEMRARAIMSLLKAKSENTPDSDSRDSQDDE